MALIPHKSLPAKPTLCLWAQHGALTLLHKGRHCESAQQQRAGDEQARLCARWPACFWFRVSPSSQKTAGIPGAPVKTAANLHIFKHAAWTHSHQKAHKHTHTQCKLSGWRDSLWMICLVVCVHVNKTTQCVCDYMRSKIGFSVI